MTDRIFELEQKRAALVDDLQAIIDKDTDATPLTDEDDKAFKDTEVAIQKLNDRINRLKTMNTYVKSVDAPVEEKTFLSPSGKSTMGIDVKKDRSREPKGTKAARFIIGAGLASKQGFTAGVHYVANELDDLEVSKALAATVSSATGGSLIPQDYRAELIDLLYSETVVRKGNPVKISMPYGNITMPRLTAGATANWIGENTDIPISQPSLDQIVMSAKKLVAMVPVSNDLIRRSPTNVETVIRSDLVKQLARKEDLTFLTAATGSSTHPPGLMNLAAAGNVANYYSGATYNTAPTLSAVNSVFSTMELQLKSQNIRTNSCKWITTPAVKNFLRTLTDSVGNYFFQRELDQGTIWGYPILETNELPTNTLVNGTPVVATTTALSTASTTITVPTTNVVVGMAITGTGITGTVLVASITDGTHLVANTAVTVASGAVLTFTPFVTTGTSLMLVAFDQVLLGETLNMFADSSSEATYVNSGTATSAYSQDQTVFRMIEEVDLQVKHPAAIAVGNLAGWAPGGFTGNAGAPYFSQTATYPASPALSATPV